MYKVDSPEDNLSLVRKVLTKPRKNILNGTDGSLSTMAVAQEAFRRAT